MGRLPDKKRGFEEKTEAWARVGLYHNLPKKQNLRVWISIVFDILLIFIALLLFDKRQEWLGSPGLAISRTLVVCTLVLCGWALARNIGLVVAPWILKRLEPAEAGTISFLFRFFTMILVIYVALRYAGVKPETLAVGGVAGAIVLGLAAQQTIANLFAGLVMITTRPFRVGEKVKLQGGMLGGEAEGVVSHLGLFYTFLLKGKENILIPNRIMVDLIVTPVLESERIEVRAKFSRRIDPVEIEEKIQHGVQTQLQGTPQVKLAEIDRSEVVMDISATPEDPYQGGELASEIIQVVQSISGETGEHIIPSQN